MNGLMRVLMSLSAVSLVAAPSAFAGETVTVYCSSTLVLTFVGFLALVVVIQLIPAVMAVGGAIKSLVKQSKEIKLKEANAVKN